MRTISLSVGVTLGCVLFAGAAKADDKSDPIRAARLFDEGRRLMIAADYAGACPKLAESQALDPAPDTAFDLGNLLPKGQPSGVQDGPRHGPTPRANRRGHLRDPPPIRVRSRYFTARSNPAGRRLGDRRCRGSGDRRRCDHGSHGESRVQRCGRLVFGEPVRSERTVPSAFFSRPGHGLDHLAAHRRGRRRSRGHRVLRRAQVEARRGGHGGPGRGAIRTGRRGLCRRAVLRPAAIADGVGTRRGPGGLARASIGNDQGGALSLGQSPCRHGLVFASAMA